MRLHADTPSCAVPVCCRAGALGPQTTHFYPPSLMTHKITYRNGKVDSMVVVYAVPIGPGQCRLINRNLFKFNGSNLPGLVMRAFPQFLLHIGTQVGGWVGW